MSIQLLLGVAVVMVIGLGARAAGAAESYADVVRADSPVIQQRFDDQTAPSATPELGHAATAFSGAVGSSDRIKPDGDFTIEWWQFVPSIDAPGPALRTGDFAFRTKPVPKAKPKDATRAVFTIDASTAGKALAYPGRWYYLAFVARGGFGQLFVNGQPDGELMKLSSHPGQVLRIEGDTSSTLYDEIAAYDRALSADRILAHFTAALPPRKIVTVGHRGDNRFAPENTRVSYEQAIAKHATVVEMDLRLTKDDVLVLLHDPTVDRTTGGSGKVNIVDLTLEQAQKLDAGSWKNAKFKGEPIPRVEDICNTCRGHAIMMLDLKCTGLGKALAKLKSRLNYPSDGWILAPWEDDEGVALRQYLPDVPMIRLTTKIPTDHFDDAYFARMKKVGFSGFSVSWPYLTQAFVDAIHAHGMNVYTWTVNDAPEVAGATLSGVDGIITDDVVSTMNLVGEFTAASH